MTDSSSKLPQNKNKPSIRYIESSTLIPESNRSRNNIQDRHQSVQSPVLQDISFMRSTSNIQNQNNSSSNTPVNNGMINTNLNQAGGVQIIKMRRKSTEYHDDHLNSYIKKYQNLATVINMHEKQQQQEAEMKKFLANQAIIMQKRNTEQRDKPQQAINIHKQRKSVLFTSEFSVFQQLQSKRELNRIGSNNNLEYDGRNRPKRQTITQNLQQQNQIILPEITFEHNNSSNISIQKEDIKIQKSQSDLSKIHAMKQYKETKKLQDTINFVDFLLKLYKKKQHKKDDNIVLNATQPESEQNIQRINFTTNQTPQLTRRQSRDLQTSSLERNINIINKSVELPKQKQTNGSEKQQQKRLLSEPKQRFDKNNFSFKNNDISQRMGISYYQNNATFRTNNINNFQNPQESLKQFATRHITQSSQLLMNLNQKDIRKLKNNPSQTEVNTLSRIFSKKSPILTPLKAPDRQSSKLPQVIKLDQGMNLNESQVNQKNSNNTFKYTTYLQNQSSYMHRKKAIISHRDATFNINGNSNNQSTDFIKLSTEASSPASKKFNGLLKRIF